MSRLSRPRRCRCSRNRRMGSHRGHCLSHPRPHHRLARRIPRLSRCPQVSRRGPMDRTGSPPLLRHRIRHRHRLRLSCPLFRLSRCRSIRWGRSRSCRTGYRTRLHQCPRREHRKSSLSRSHRGMSLRRSNPSRTCTRRSLTTHRCHRPYPRCRRFHRHRCQ